jgi:hypothetical protein
MFFLSSRTELQRWNISGGSCPVHVRLRAVIITRRTSKAHARHNEKQYRRAAIRPAKTREREKATSRKAVTIATACQADNLNLHCSSDPILPHCQFVSNSGRQLAQRRSKQT